MQNIPYIIRISDIPMSIFKILSVEKKGIIPVSI